MARHRHIVAWLEEVADDLRSLRQDIHAHPELGFEERRTAALVAECLRGWGYEVHEGIGRTGVVGVLRQGDGTRRLGLRADMDALPIVEATGLGYSSCHGGRMHACGHDGHTAMLLGAARYLAATRRFDGTLVLIFQPAEEGQGGAEAMLADGLLERFPCDALFGMHNMPGLEGRAPGLPRGTDDGFPGPAERHPGGRRWPRFDAAPERRSAARRVERGDGPAERGGAQRRSAEGRGGHGRCIAGRRGGQRHTPARRAAPEPAGARRPGARAGAAAGSPDHRVAGRQLWVPGQHRALPGLSGAGQQRRGNRSSPARSGSSWPARSRSTATRRS